MDDIKDLQNGQISIWTMLLYRPELYHWSVSKQCIY
jgi:hypothetical protein